MRGKALVRLTVNEGPQYRIGDFEVNGAKRFSNDDIARYYPFGEKGGPGMKGEGSRGLIGRPGTKEPNDVFNATAWDDATTKVQDAYENEGYIYASIRPIIERRRVGPDSVATVDLRWEIDERTPAIVNRIDIFGNDVTTETCIRDQLYILPGDVFNKARLIDSYRNIANLGFFEQDMPTPTTNPANEQGDINLIFNVKEKRTGNVNFGASVGQGTGVGGFIGFDQPNLFGECKKGSLQWQFGQYIRDFSLSYTDPRIKQSNVSGTVSLYNQRSRFVIRDIGVSNTSGGQMQFGFLLPNSRNTRFYTSYGGERVSYGGDGLVSTINCNGCFRSTLGFTLDHDTRLGSPFPVAGTCTRTSRCSSNGGPLGGTASFQRLTTEMRSYSTLATFGSALGPEPMALVFGSVGAGWRAVRRPGAVLCVAGHSRSARRAVRQSAAWLRRVLQLRRKATSSQRRASSRRNGAPSGMRIIPAPSSLACGLASSCISTRSMTRATCGNVLGTSIRPGCSVVPDLVRHSSHRSGPLGVDLGYGFRSHRRDWGIKIPSGRFTSSLARSSNRSLSWVPFLARRRSRS